MSSATTSPLRDPLRDRQYETRQYETRRCETLRYVSTRGESPALDFGDVLLSGPAPDGGLYVPTEVPALEQPATAAARDYAGVAVAVMEPFVGDSISRADLSALVSDAYAGFDHPQVCPLVRLDDDHYLLEMFHGPTCAFKDIALQVVARLLDHELERRDSRAMIVVATSGDTGSAAMEAVRDRDRIDIVVLHPAGRTSEIQRLQMTTIPAGNVHAVAVDGTFDDCQDLVKAMFADEAFRAEMNLASANSINWARVMAQIVYYVWADRLLDDDRAATFCVPTGNFGNIYAGHYARRMGLAIDRLLIASNSNDILSRLVATGELLAEPVVPTLSPSMDIQISSNLERLLFELLDGNGAATAGLLSSFREQGRAGLDEARRQRLRSQFGADRVSDPETLETMAGVHAASGRLIDPHSAVAVAVAERLRRPGELIVTLATAHPAKFAAAVVAATGVVPEPPAVLAGVSGRPERFSELGNDLRAVQGFVRSLARSG